MVLFGPSGSGKTTILRCLAGLDRPQEGFIRFGEEVWFDAAAGIDRPPQQRRLAYVSQDYGLFPHLTVEQNIRFGMDAVGTARTRSRRNDPANGPSRGDGRAVPNPIVRRRTPARRPGTRAGERSTADPARRAARRARSAVARSDATGIASVPEVDRRSERRRHARPRRCADARRSDGRAVGRLHPPGGAGPRGLQSADRFGRRGVGRRRDGRAAATSSKRSNGLATVRVGASQIRVAQTACRRRDRSSPASAPRT